MPTPKKKPTKKVVAAQEKPATKEIKASEPEPTSTARCNCGW